MRPSQPPVPAAACSVARSRMLAMPPEEVRQQRRFERSCARELRGEID